MMGEKHETQSNWACVSGLIEDEKPIVLGQATSNLYLHRPREMLTSLSFYKFAAKMIGKNKRVLNFDCGEGLGSWVLAQECGYCKGVDQDREAIASAQHNFSDPSVEFALSQEAGIQWDAIVQLDPKDLQGLDKKVEWLSDQGIVLFRVQTPVEALEAYFGQIFQFSMIGEMIYPGELKVADHAVILACQPKRKQG